MEAYQNVIHLQRDRDIRELVQSEDRLCRSGQPFEIQHHNNRWRYANMCRALLRYKGIWCSKTLQGCPMYAVLSKTPTNEVLNPIVCHSKLEARLPGGQSLEDRKRA